MNEDSKYLKLEKTEARWEKHTTIHNKQQRFIMNKEKNKILCIFVCKR